MVRSPDSTAETDIIRDLERKRLSALVRADLDLVSEIHSDDFQLINPRGESISKDQYLAGIASGEINYMVWEPGKIDVRLYTDGAVIRYISELEIVVRGQKVPRQRYWHTDIYERREGRWQVVWSQATESAS
jgi:hypothetical protein